MADLPGPYEFLDLPDGGDLTVHPTNWEFGEGLINPRDGRAPRMIPILRIHVPATEKATLPQWWDVTSKTVQPTLAGVLPSVIARKQGIRLTKHGEGVKARFTVDVL